MEIKQLQMFVAVCERGTFTDGARHLGISQPQLSIGIGALERALGAPLFDRASTGVILTRFGRAFEPRARELLNTASRAEIEIRELLGTSGGRVVIGAVPTYAEAVIPEAVARFHTAYPRVEVCVREGYLSRMVPALLTGELDCAFGTFGTYTLSPDLSSEILLSSLRTIIVAGEGHPLTRKRRVSVREAWEQSWTMPATPDIYRVRLADIFATKKLPLPTSFVQFTTVGFQKRILRRGVHLGSIAEITARDEFASGLLRKVRTPELSWSFDSGVVYRNTAKLTPVAVNLISVVRQVCDEIGKWRSRDE